MELRLYSFVNHYLSSIQQGIQTGHAAVRLVRKYHDLGSALITNDWADNHETFIILNGGDDDAIKEATSIIVETDFPFATFNESVQSLNGLRTCVAVILPETIFNARRDTLTSKINDATCYLWEGFDEKGKPAQISYTPTHTYYKLVNLVKSCRLAS